MPDARPLVAVKCKLGELSALDNLRSGRDALVRVMVELLDSAKPGGQILPALVRAAVSAAEYGRTLWLDTTWLALGSPLARQPGGVFEYLDNLIESAVSESSAFSPPISPAWSPSSQPTRRTTNCAGCGS